MTSVTSRTPDTAEWPTLWVAAALYAGYGALTWFHQALPFWLIAPLGGYLVALHGSLQHEVVHGHPTKNRWLNEALVFPSLWLWLPFRRYRDSHLRHHACPVLTDPLADPESFYRTSRQWAEMPPWQRALLRANNTLLGRLTFGPALAAIQYLCGELRRGMSGGEGRTTAWLLHGLSVAAVLGWVMMVCGIPLLEYLALYVYPGLSLTLLRSYIEHQASDVAAERTAVVESGPLLSLAFLNNNLHAIHHEEPGVAWYRLPERWRTRRAARLSEPGCYHLSGYRAVAAKYLVRAKEPVHWPLST